MLFTSIYLYARVRVCVFACAHACVLYIYICGGCISKHFISFEMSRVFQKN